MKKVFSVLAILLLCFSMPVGISANAVSFGIVQPYYEKAAEAVSELSINGTTATCESLVRGHSDVVEITAVQYLEKQGFSVDIALCDGFMAGCSLALQAICTKANQLI